MTRLSLDIPVTPEPVVHVGTDAELHNLALVDVQAQHPPGPLTVQQRTCADSSHGGSPRRSLVS